MRFQLLFVFVFFASIITVYCVIPGQAEKVQKNAFVKMDPNNKPRTFHGKLQFQEFEDVTIEVDGIANVVHLLKQDIDSAKPIPDGQEAAVYAGDTGNGRVVCRHECWDENNCDMPCVMEGDETVYIHGVNALVISGGSGEIDSMVPWALREPEHVFRRKRAARLHPTLQDRLTDSRVVKLIAFPDSKFMELFMHLNSNNVEKAKADVVYFLTLVANQMTMHYQSLKDYGMTFTRGQAGPRETLDIAVQYVDIEFPKFDTNTHSFVNFIWSSANVIGDNVYYHGFDNGTYSTSWGIQTEFRDWLKDSYSTNVPFDHAVAMTGYDLRLQYDDGVTTYDSNPAGATWRRVTCHSAYKYWGYHSSVIELTSSFSRLISHELAHAMGAYHDVVGGCPDTKYIMAQTLFYESTSTRNDYYRFSRCSANFIKDHLSNIAPGYFVSTCLSSPTQAFLHNFCTGFSGNYTQPMRQCQLKYGSSSAPFSGSVRGIAGDYYVTRCVMDATVSNPYALYCSNGGTYYAIRIADGTKCVDDTGSLSDYICFHGSCVTPPTVC